MPDLEKTTVDIEEELRQFRLMLRQHLSDDQFELCDDAVLCNASFQIFPASTSKHHDWRGGLLQHTRQVAMAAKAIVDLSYNCNMNLDKQVVLTACVFHDFGKIYDYYLNSADFKWQKTAHYHTIHHVAKSYSYFLEKVAAFDHIEVPFKEAVSHCILAHHGRLEYGSPVVPQTREAWTVHIADMTSVFCIELRKPGKD